jgi:hypothetical protein
VCSSDLILEELCLRIEEVTGIDGVLIRKTLGSFVVSGYIKAETAGKTVNWFWTHNNCIVHHPMSLS